MSQEWWQDIARQSVGPELLIGTRSTGHPLKDLLFPLFLNFSFPSSTPSLLTIECCTSTAFRMALRKYILLQGNEDLGFLLVNHGSHPEFPEGHDAEFWRIDVDLQRTRYPRPSYSYRSSRTDSDNDFLEWFQTLPRSRAGFPTTSENV